MRLQAVVPGPLRGAGLTVLGALGMALLAGVYARGGAGWVLGFVAFVPWLWVLDRTPRLGATLGAAIVASVAYTAAVLPWFGGAIGRFTGLGDTTGTVVLLLAAPLLQPQFIALALVRRWAGRAFGPAIGALAGIAAWTATEAFVPRLLGDTLGYGLAPATWVRQAADLGGVAGLTVALLAANEALASALRRRSSGWRAAAVPLALAALVPTLLAGYGALRLATLPSAPGATLRMGLVQSNIVDYERLRRERGTGAVVREVLDTHYAMTYDAVERQKAQAVLWSETVYPTTFASPKSAAGAELDQEIVSIVEAAGVPFVFGTYDRDAAGEYNAAAFVQPGRGLVGFYRKVRLFPLTEVVPPWLDGPVLRRWLPWAGTWQPGAGPRVLPLRLADGREIPALPLICLDTVDAGLVIDGARLGAQVILTMSNDSWFTDHPTGARLHLAVAAMRSVETRLPQFRVTSNGYSAVIDATGRVTASSRMGERTLVVGDVAVGEPPRTVAVAWGDWVGRAAAVLLLALAAWAAMRRPWRPDSPEAAAAGPGPTPAAAGVHGLPWQADVVVLPPVARMLVGALRVISRGGLLVMAVAAVVEGAAWPANPLAQLRLFGAVVLAPELAAWLLQRAFAARLSIESGGLTVQGRAGSAGQRLAWPVGDVAVVRAWRLPLPGLGATVRSASPSQAPLSLAGADADSLARALHAFGGRAALDEPPWLRAYTRAARSVPRSRIDRPWITYGLLPLALALPAFRLHQHIAYGSSFGEVTSFGLGAYLQGLALWWAGWAIGVAVTAAALRAGVEAATLAAARWRPASATGVRWALDRAALAALYLGLPAWFAWRLLGG